MPASKPGILVNHRAEQVWHFVIGALPQRAKCPRRTDDREVQDVVALGDLAQFIGHARAAGDPGDHALRSGQHAFENFLRAAHFPQHVDVDRAVAARHFVGAFDLSDRTVDAVADQLLVAFLAGQGFVNLGYDLALGIIAIGIDRADRADPTSGRPSTRTHAVGGRDALAALDHRPDFTSTIKNWLQAFEAHGSSH